jgi:hypothetical protein
MEISPEALVNSVGLVFDIVGVLLLFRYGLPEELSRSGHEHLVTGQIDEGEKAKAAMYVRWSRVALFYSSLGSLSNS